MSSSASKLTGGQGQHRQQAGLHPAAAVFRDELLGNVCIRNNALEKNNARFRNLANLVQDIKLSFYMASPRREEQENPFHIEYHETFNVKHKLPRGSIVTTLDDDDEERLVLPIEDAPAHPVEDCGAIGCVTLYMAGGVPFGSFPCACRYVNDAAKMSVEEDGSVHLFLRLSKEIVIKGKLHSSQMSNEALIEHVEHPHFMSCLTWSEEVMRGWGLFEGEEEYRKGIVYTPLSISIQVNPWLKKTLALVDQISPSGGSRADVELESEDGLCCLVVEALGDSEHKELFHEYLALKLSNLMLSVNVSHSRGSFTVTLDEGTRSADSWYINVDVGDRSMIPVSELHRMEVTVLGMQLRLLNGLSLIGEMHPHPLMHHHTVWQMRFQAGCSNLNFYFLVSFNWSEFTGEEIADIVDCFPSKMSNALYGIRNTIFPRNDTATFPLAFKANVLGISCDLSWAKRRLEWVGLWEE